MNKLLKHFQDTESPIEWLVEQLENHNVITRAAFDNVVKEAKQKEVELIQKTINRTLLVYKELKRD